MTVSRLTAQLAVELRCDVGESPVWDSSTGTLIFVDMTPGRVFRFDPGSRALSSFDIGREVGAVASAQDGGLVIAAHGGIHLAHADGSGMVRHAAVEPDTASSRMNDAKVDPVGRLWAGTMAVDSTPGAGSLYRITDDRVDRVVGGTTLSNGLGWSPDGSLMYFIDSATYTVDVFDCDLDRGEVSGRRVAVAATDDGGMPDGLTVDAVGNIWVAYFGAAVVRCFTPGGVLVAVVDLPVSQPTSVTFGGDLLDVLYITTAAYELDDAALAREPLAGSLFECRPGVTGTPAHSFGPVLSSRSNQPEVDA